MTYESLISVINGSDFISVVDCAINDSDVVLQPYSATSHYRIFNAHDNNKSLIPTDKVSGGAPMHYWEVGCTGVLN